ncbi:MAG: DUF333 domain-containing protein [Candidatus Pacebacteria bacterium]|nr:DUF333 domain-containing protein [Candidatus Paceibacterota bacterium]
MSIKYKNILVALLIIILLGLVIWLAATRNNCEIPDQNPELYTQAEAKDIARNWVLTNSSTYKFDGYDLNYKSVKLLKCVNCYQYAYSFKSKYPGYGDRTGTVLKETVTPHVITVNTQKGEVIEVITDGKYDEIKMELLGEQINNTKTEATTTTIANPASTYCKQQGGSLEIREFIDGQRGFCVFEDGSECEEWKFFRKECSMGKSFCQDFCGDGTCQEMVCMAVGCPCAENANNCPIDCTE